MPIASLPAPALVLVTAAAVGLGACRDKGADSASTPSDTSETGGETGETDTGEFVDPCDEGTIHIDDDPTAYPSIQDALNVIEDGSTLYVCPGRHTEAITFNTLVNPLFATGGAISIVGSSAEDTIIDADGQGSAIIMYSLNVEISDLTLTSGTGNEYMDYHDGPSYYGGAIYNLRANITLNRVVIEQNSASTGGGIWVYGFEGYPTIVLNDCVIRRNISEGYSNEDPPFGGGAFLSGPARLESYNTDWGEGADDNEPEDIAILPEGGLLRAYSFGADASFVCDTANTDEPCQVLE